MLEGRAAQENTKELKKSQYFFQPVSDIKTTITGAFHFHDAQIVRFLALVTTMVTTVDHGNHRSNDRGNDRSNHRGYYDRYYNVNA